MGVVDNSLEIVQVVFLLGSTELGQVNLILINHTKAGPLLKNWNCPGWCGSVD